MAQKVRFKILTILIGIMMGILIIGLNPAVLPDISSNTAELNDSSLEKSSFDMKVLWAYPWGGYESDVGQDIAIDAEGYIYTTGYTNGSSGKCDLVLYKFDTDGTKIWNTTWGGPDDDCGLGVTVDSRGFIYCTGFTEIVADGRRDLILIKFDSAGELIWNTSYHLGDYALGFSVAIDSDDDVYVVGYEGYLRVVINVTLWDYSLRLIKFNSNGNFIWGRQFGEINFTNSIREYGYGIAIDSDDFIYVTGFWVNASEWWKQFLILVKFDAAGNQIWNVTWNEFSCIQGADVAIDSTGAIYCIGIGIDDFYLAKVDHNGDKSWVTTSAITNKSYGVIPGYMRCGITIDSHDLIYCTSTIENSTFSYDVVLTTFDSNGTKKWNSTWGGADEDVGWAITHDAADNIYIIGTTTSWGWGFEDFLVMRIASHETLYNPEVSWDRIWGGKFDEYGEDVAIDPYGYIYCVGSTSSYGAGGSDFLLIKFNSNGKRIWNTTWGGTNHDYANALAIDSAANIYCVGTTQSFGAGSTDVALVKFYPNGVKAWNITWGTPVNDEGLGATMDSDGNIYMMGNTHLLKFFPNGTNAWDIQAGNLSIAYDVTIDSNASIYCVGIKQTEYVADSLLVKFNSSGSVLWESEIHYFERVNWWLRYLITPSELFIDSKGYIYCLGQVVLYGESYHTMALVKCDSKGVPLWGRTWDCSSSDESGYGLAMDSTGYLFCIGSGKIGDSANLALVKFDAAGNKKWETTWGGFNEDGGKGLALDSQGNLYCVGSTKSFGANSSDLVLVKIDLSVVSGGVPGFEFLFLMMALGIPIMIQTLLKPRKRIGALVLYECKE